MSTYKKDHNRDCVRHLPAEISDFDYSRLSSEQQRCYSWKPNHTSWDAGSYDFNTTGSGIITTDEIPFSGWDNSSSDSSSNDSGSSYDSGSTDFGGGDFGGSGSGGDW